MPNQQMMASQPVLTAAISKRNQFSKLSGPLQLCQKTEPDDGPQAEL